MPKKTFTYEPCPQVAMPPPHPPILYTFGISFVLTDLGKTYSQKLPQNNKNEPYNYLKTS